MPVPPRVVIAGAGFGGLACGAGAPARAGRRPPRRPGSAANFFGIPHAVGLGSRIIVFVTWAWNHFFYDRPARLTVGPSADEPRLNTKEL